MIYEQLIRRIADNMNMPIANGVFRATARRDIYDVLNLIGRKSEFPKKLFEVVIADSDAGIVGVDPPVPVNSVNLPSDFYIPVEVMFFATSGNRFAELEMSRETYEKWNPNVLLVTESFNDLVTSGTPLELMWTQENFDYDGYIGYHFTETQPRTIIWKPAANGTLKVYYTTFDEQFLANQYSNVPNIHAVFSEIVVDGVTTKMLVRKLKTAKTEVEFYGLKTELNEYKEKFKEGVNDFVGYTQKRATSPRMEPFDFLNDPDMLI